MTRPAERFDFGVVSKLFRGLGDPMRLAILELLADGEQRVTDLVSVLETSQPNVSGHLACLKECGLIEDRPLGRSTLYRLVHPELFELLRSAEALLAAVGHHVELCRNYEGHQ